METPASTQDNPNEALATSVPTVSIITPAYQVAGLIGPTIDSVFAQTYQDFEWVIVNDGSPDTEQLESVLEPYSERITYVRQQNSGAAIARNTAIEHASGKYLAFLDGDDIWFPDYLESQISYLEANGYSMVYSDAELIGESEGFGKTFMEQAPSSGEVSVASLLALETNVITSGTVVLKRAVDEVGRFENRRIQGEDFNLWVRIAKAGFRIGYRNVPKLQYRVSSSGFSGGAENRMVRAIDAFRRIQDQIELSEDELEILLDKIKDFEADLSVVRGKKYLLEGNFAEARREFKVANRRKWRWKLTATMLLSRVAPKFISRLYLKLNPSEVVFVNSR